MKNGRMLDMVKKCMGNIYIRALKTIRESEESSEHPGAPINEIVVRKLSTISTLPTETGNQVIEKIKPLSYIT